MITIVVPCFNELEICKKSIDSIIENTEGEHKIVIVDNANPNEGILEYLSSVAKNNVTVRHLEKNVGCHNACNEGFDIWHSKYYAKVDDDVIVPKGWNIKLIEFLEDNPDFSYVGARNANFGHLKELTTVGTSGKEWKILSSEGKGRNVIGFSCVLFRDSTIELYGPLKVPRKDCLYGGEEQYYAALAELHKHKIALLNEDMRIHHQETTDLDYVVWKYVYGYLGFIKEDFIDFKKNLELKIACYLKYQDAGVREELVQNRLIYFEMLKG